MSPHQHQQPEAQPHPPARSPWLQGHPRTRRRIPNPRPASPEAVACPLTIHFPTSVRPVQKEGSGAVHGRWDSGLVNHRQRSRRGWPTKAIWLAGIVFPSLIDDGPMPKCRVGSPGWCPGRGRAKAVRRVRPVKTLRRQAPSRRIRQEIGRLVQDPESDRSRRLFRERAPPLRRCCLVERGSASLGALAGAHAQPLLP